MLWGGVDSNNTNLESKANTNNEIPFCFHILTDKLSQNMLDKIKALEVALNEFYPSSFKIYTLCDSVFQGLPKLNDDYLTYFRIKMASVLPKDIKICLYLDIDMLCVSDIREIFNIDLDKKICGVVRDCYYSKNINNVDSKKPGFKINTDSYFNSGFMLIDLEKWRNFEVEKKCFDFLANYIPVFHDQDALNAILSEHIKILGLEYNFAVGILESNYITTKHFKNGDVTNPMIYTYDEFLEAKDKIKILHYLTRNKPWIINQDCIYAMKPPYKYKWWSLAFKTPIFGDELRDEYIKYNEESIYNLTKQLADISVTARRVGKIIQPSILIIKKLRKLKHRIINK